MSSAWTFPSPNIPIVLISDFQLSLNRLYRSSNYWWKTITIINVHGIVNHLFLEHASVSISCFYPTFVFGIFGIILFPTFQRLQLLLLYIWVQFKNFFIHLTFYQAVATKLLCCVLL